MMSFEQKYNELVEYLQDLGRRYRDLSNYEEAHECFNALLALHEHRDRLEERHTAQVNRLNRKTIRFPGLEAISHPDPKLPVLFMSDRPVLKLFARNIKNMSYTREDVARILGEHVPEGFEVKRLLKTWPLNAKITCHTLAASCKLQCLSIVGELNWSFTNKAGRFCTGNIIVVPDANQEKNPIKSFKAEMIEDGSLLHVCHFVRPVAQHLFKFLSLEDRHNVYIATGQSTNLLLAISQGGINGEWPFFRGSLAMSLIKQALKHMRPKFVRFPLLGGDSVKDLHPEIVYSAFASILAEEKEHEIREGQSRLGKYDFVREIDLSGVQTTGKIMHVICENFKVEELTLGQTASSFEKQIVDLEVVRLNIINNSIYTANSLKKENFVTLKTLNLVNCPIVCLSNLSQFIASSDALKELTLVNCVFDGRRKNLITLIKTVFSDKSILETFNFTFTNDVVGKVKKTFVLDSNMLGSDNCLINLNLSNNVLMETSLPYLVARSPSLKTLIISGLSCPVGLSFNSLECLEFCKLQYYHDCTLLLATISRRCKAVAVEIVNELSLSNKKIKPIQLQNLEGILSSGKDRCIVFQKCKIPNRYPRFLDSLISSSLVEVLKTDVLFSLRSKKL